MNGLYRPLIDRECERALLIKPERVHAVDDNLASEGARE